MTTAHWVINLSFALSLLANTVKIARDPDWSEKAGAMLLYMVLAAAGLGCYGWALHQIGAFPWVRP